MKLIKQSQEVTSTITKEHDKIIVTTNRGGCVTEIPFHILSGAEAYSFFVKLPPRDSPIRRVDL